MDILKREIGVNFNSDHIAAVKVWAPKATQVAIQTGELLLELTPDLFGYWSLPTALIKPGDRYEFILDNDQRLADPASLSQPDGVHGSSLAIDTRYNWTDADWENIPLQDYIFYEIHTGTFSHDGTFKGIADHLDHLVNLGITAIELMPVASFPGKRNWGYDGVFPFSVQESYGGAAGLQQLVDLCHQKGLAVVLDVVYNHVGPEGNYLDAFGPYFTDKYKTPWGNAINFDDQGSDGVRNYFIENVLMWFRDFHIDALRLDAVHAIKDFGALHILEEIRCHTSFLLEKTGRKHYLIAECDLNDPRYITPIDENGFGMNAQWVDEFHHALRVTAGEPAKGYYKDFSGIQHLAKSYTDAYVYTGMYSVVREKTFGRMPIGKSADHFVVFSQNHDQTGNRMLGERTSKLFSFEMYKLMAGAVLFSPFLPLLFMGEEWGETNPFLYFVDHSDPKLIAQVRKGRKEEFAAMFDQGETPDPQDEATFNQSRLNWELIGEHRHACIFSYYQQLIFLRKKYLSSAAHKAPEVRVLAAQNCLLLERKCADPTQLVWCVLNFSTQQFVLDIPDHIVILKELVNSASSTWLGPGEPATEDLTHQIIVPSESFIAYSAKYV
ncbi:malto-oligosyltrehalose trehalohydrolase [Pedobacter cryoconitis]|uniref:Malto-oligosyltrehalose trehalohydrolase n=1 Tax=Pedobacter cryoconitis TaxID=188932 RepID=A0A327SNL7_9SPHI|nr:malto-oligosyltrehalose trehalohydrolase [Pedobacter cryoconitis]RAJ27287.1 maltooligosyltrehalose trehalohydrolase [Pedobacter cryoconitis]